MKPGAFPGARRRAELSCYATILPGGSWLMRNIGKLREVQGVHGHPQKIFPVNIALISPLAPLAAAVSLSAPK